MSNEGCDWLEGYMSGDTCQIRMHIGCPSPLFGYEAFETVVNGLILSIF